MSKLNLIAWPILAALLLLASCKPKEFSSTTGMPYGDPDGGGFDRAVAPEQATGPGLVLIEGGAFTMGSTNQDVMYDWNALPRQVTLSSFYMDETEIRNIDYREYLYWIKRVFINNPIVYKDALPDTLVWRKRLAYNEPFVEYYFRYPSFNDYPVVGVTWLQADAYCQWRSDRVNEKILIDEGILDPNPNQQGEDNFNTEAYLAGQYQTMVHKIPSNNPNQSGGRDLTLEDGILLPRYMLPTEAEWEYAALALIGNSIDERLYTRRIYPWNGHYLRNDTREFMGYFNANFQRGRGDLMGIAGYLNDNAAPTSPVDAYWPNEYGLYCMAGNVNEWVRDVYRQSSSLDVEGFRPFRGNIFQTLVVDANNRPVPKDSMGRLYKENVKEQDALNRDNYKKADNINYVDGDVQSRIMSDWKIESDTLGTGGMYYPGRGSRHEGITSLVNDHARVYKGGSWQDRPYWLSPGSRRFLDENKCAADIGFRCSMIRVGSPTGY